MTMSKEERKRRNAACRKRLIKRRKDLGLCIYCGAPTKHGKAACDDCIAWISRKQKALREERRKKRLCTRCGTPLEPWETSAMCWLCHAEDRVRYQKRKQK